MKKVVYLLLAFVFTSCINLKSPYPDIKYYRLSNEPLMLVNLDTLPISVQLRNITINDEFNTDHIIATDAQTRKVQVYYYNRWISKFDDLATGFLLSRISSYGVFSGGFHPASSINDPDYILEGRVINLTAINSEKKNSPDANSVEITINCSFYRRSNEFSGLNLLFNKSYTQRVNRINNFVETIPQATSRAMALISDMILVDMINHIKMDRNIN
ncbi:MAG TPA: hypothetical protein PLU67_07450 [Candidatus Kapabacteria bacterium]|nr:hypothetical protein [Candidatus Kapabacteria bacterium]HPP39411.1 hypothetical protein [Candidatus Kapabacteria bacterium]